jgi:hypothetical protein
MNSKRFYYRDAKGRFASNAKTEKILNLSPLWLTSKLAIYESLQKNAR